MPLVATDDLERPARADGARRAGRLGPHRRRRRLLAAVATAAALGLAACGGDESSTPGEGGAPSAVAEQGPALEHIHGLGIDPADGRLFIATHNGLFSAAEGETTPKQVGTSTQDIMGFSVAGPDRFIGSGHPSLDQDLPPSLGLIESRDGGRSWENVSLLGEADFHVLESSGGRIYGFDGASGLLKVSRDGRSWKDRTPPAGIFALSIDPGDASRVVASTEQGLFVSGDEGRTWRSLSGELAGLLAWPREDELYLLDGEGRVSVSSDTGRTWRAQGSIGGQPVAFTAHEEELYAALADGTVKRSADGGATWAVRTTTS